MLGSSQKCGFASPSTVIVGMPSPRTSRLAEPSPAASSSLSRKSSSPSAVRDDQVRAGELACVERLRLVVLRPDTGRDDRADRDPIAADLPDDVREDRGRRHDRQGVSPDGEAPPEFARTGRPVRRRMRRRSSTITASAAARRGRGRVLDVVIGSGRDLVGLACAPRQAGHTPNSSRRCSSTGSRLAGDVTDHPAQAGVVDLGRPAAARADHVMVVDRLAADVGVLAGRQIDALDDAELLEDLERPEDRRPTDAEVARPRLGQMPPP